MIRFLRGLFIKKFKEIFLRELFFPGIIGIFINPYYFARKALLENIKALSEYIKGDTLDIGCGQRPYEKLFSGATSYIGLEIDNPENRTRKKADVFYDSKTFPFENDRFDSVVMFEVLEHVFNLDEFLRELYRVLKVKGVLLMSVSFIWDEHEQPYDFARYTSFGIKDLLERYGFQILKHKKSLKDIRVIFQLLNAYFDKVLFSKGRFVYILSTFFIIAPINILGSIMNLFLPKNDDLYLDNIILATKVTKANRHG